MKSGFLKIFALTLLLTCASHSASAAIYGTYIFPNGFSPLGYPADLSFTFSATNPDDADDIVGLSLAAEATAPVFTTVCPTFVDYYFSGWQTVPNPAIGTTLSQTGYWVVYCTGLYYVSGIHVFYLDNGESYVDGSLAFYGFI